MSRRLSARSISCSGRSIDEPSPQSPLRARNWGPDRRGKTKLPLGSGMIADDDNHRLFATEEYIVIGNRQLVGIVSIGDVVKYRLEDLEAESNVLRDAYIAAH
jgi:hypothetical protein